MEIDASNKKQPRLTQHGKESHPPSSPLISSTPKWFHTYIYIICKSPILNHGFSLAVLVGGWFPSVPIGPGFPGSIRSSVRGTTCSSRRLSNASGSWPHVGAAKKSGTSQEVTICSSPKLLFQWEKNCDNP